LNGCAEVSLNLLAPGEAVELLLGTAQIKDADAAALAAAEEIAVLCGNLPLYLSICGGIIAGYEDDPSWKAEVVGMLVEDRVGLIEDTTGDRTVERLVDSSLSMLKDEQTSLAFMALGVCPEDALVELPVAQLICSADADVAAAGKPISSMSMRRILKMLLDRHLMQGSIAHGAQLHDIVRDLVRSRLGGEDGIRVKQRVLVAAFAAACSADGWSADDAVGQYMEQALELHMLEALLPSPLDDAEAHVWLLHANELMVVTNAATAFGSATLEALSAAKEGAGDLVGAARVAWAARLVKGLPAAIFNELVYRAANLLETANDSSCADFEIIVLKKGYFALSPGTARAEHSQARLVAIQQASGVQTFGSKTQQQFADWGAGFMANGYFMKPWPCPMADVRIGSSMCRQAVLTHAAEGNRLTSIPHEQHCLALWWAMNLWLSSSTCDMEDWDPNLCGGEAALAAALAYYAEDPIGHGKEIASGAGSAGGTDPYRYGTQAGILALCFGNVPALYQWAEDATIAYKDLDLPKTRNYFADGGGSVVGFSRPVICLLIELDRPAAAFALLEALGFDWSDAGYALYETAFEGMSQTLPGFVGDADAVFQKLLVYLASPQSDALDAEVGAWIPVPSVLAQHEREHAWCQHYLLHGILVLAGAVFLRLGRAGEAEEAARILVSPEHHCVQHHDFARGHGMLGQVAAERGDAEAADGHFGRASEAAAASCFPLLEVLTARDWKRAVPASGAVADAVIDAACAKMGKSHSELACGV
jgi:hypothetical protein